MSTVDSLEQSFLFFESTIFLPYLAMSSCPNINIMHVPRLQTLCCMILFPITILFFCAIAVTSGATLQGKELLGLEKL